MIIDYHLLAKGSKRTSALGSAAMGSLFVSRDRQAILDRLEALRPDSPRQWGKMDVAQMLTHCARSMEVATGDKPRRQALIGRLLGPMVRKKFLGDQPLSHSSPTDPTFVVKDAQDFTVERVRLRGLIERFAELGPDHAGEVVHSFLGRMSGAEWDCLMYKHLDHHLRQFGG